MTKSVTAWRVVSEIVSEDGQSFASEIDSVSTVYPCIGVRRYFNGFNGEPLRIVETPARQAADVIRSHYATFSSTGADWAAAEPYEHPHDGTYEEITCHLNGFTDQEIRAIVRMVEYK